MDMKYNKEEHLIVEREETSVNGRVYKRGKFYCITNGKTYDSLGGLRNAIRPMTIEAYYREFYMLESEGKCEMCGKATSFRNVIDGFKRFCSDKCAMRSEDHRQAVAYRFVGQPEKRKRAVELAEQTRSKRTPEEKAAMNARRLATLTERYGEDYLSNRTKAQWQRRTEEEKRELSEKANRTKLKRGTMEFNPYAHANKKVTVGEKTYHCQGYEDVIIQYLHDYGFTTDDILNGKHIPRIPFKGNKSGVYRPDIFLPKINLLIEVKSDFTYAHTEKLQAAVHAKQKASIEAGFNHVIIAIKFSPLSDSDKACIKEYLDMAISSQACESRKVQRLSGDTEYRPNAIGSGSARVPMK